MSQIATPQCTVCGEESASVKDYGGRSYCERHIHLFYQDSRELWRACIISFGAVIFSIVLSAIVTIFSPSGVSDAPVLLPGVLVSVLPGITWMAALYRYSRISGSDTSPLVPLFAVAGMLVAAAVTHPFANEIIDMVAWLSRTTAANRLLGNILLGGFFHIYVQFMIVRIAGWTHPTFFQRTTGIILSLAATLGYATMLCIMYVFDNGGLLILTGNLRLVSMLCSFVAPSLVLGYFIGISRFEDLPFSRLVTGIALAAILNGLMTYVSSETGYVGLSLTQSGFSPWPGAVVCMVAVVGVYVGVFSLIQRQNHLSRARLEITQ